MNSSQDAPQRIGPPVESEAAEFYAGITDALHGLGIALCNRGASPDEICNVMSEILARMQTNSSGEHGIRAVAPRILWSLFRNRVLADPERRRFTLVEGSRQDAAAALVGQEAIDG